MRKSEAYRLRKSIIDLYGHIKNRLEVGGMPPIVDALYSKAPAYIEIKDRANELFDYIVDNDEIRLAEVFAKLDENIICSRADQCFSIEIAADTQPEVRGMFNITTSIYSEMGLFVRRCKEYVSDIHGEPQPDQTSDAMNLTPEPQQEQTKPTRGKGRPKETLKDKMIDDADGEKLQKIHSKLCGKKGKDAALIILACIKKGWITKPTFTQVKNEFGDIGSKTGYNRYLNEQMFTREELEGAINTLC